MKIISFDDYVLIQINRKDKIITLVDYLELFTFKTSSPNNVIINLLDTAISSHLIIKHLLPFHFIWQKRNNSFILVSNMSKKISKDLVSIQSLEEALDFFYMEQLTRNI